jgi:hypothetical protein
MIIICGSFFNHFHSPIRRLHSLERDSNVRWFFDHPIVYQGHRNKDFNLIFWGSNFGIFRECAKIFQQFMWTLLGQLF